MPAFAARGPVGFASRRAPTTYRHGNMSKRQSNVIQFPGNTLVNEPAWTARGVKDGLRKILKDVEDGTAMVKGTGPPIGMVVILFDKKQDLKVYRYNVDTDDVESAADDWVAEMRKRGQ